MRELPVSREMIDAFGGYDHNLRISEGSFYDMKNLTSADYPILSPREVRGIYARPEAAHGLIDKGELCYVDGSYIVVGGERVDMGLSDSVKTLISMGAYIIICPDKKYINTTDLSDRGSIEASVTVSNVEFSLCKSDGTAYGDIPAQEEEPENPETGDLWIDTSSTPHGLYQYSQTSGMWISVATTYIKISAEGIGAPFSDGDGVNISGVVSDALGDLNGSMIIQMRGDDFIVVTGILDAVSSQEEPITVSRLMPNMDFMTESGNRLWGCRYGIAQNGEMVNEIYASKLGDFKNWNCFQGISTDSFAATVGTDGPFTAAATHLGYPIFFKENCMHKIYGSYPGNYQIQTTTCRGVQRGCSRSLVTVNEVLFYKSRSGVCAYDGSLPSEISSALGDISYFDAVAGALGNKYYISMRDANGAYNLFVYDSKRALWYKEDELCAEDFCTSGGELYFIDSADGAIKTVRAGAEPEADTVRWFAETGILGASSPDKKFISRLDVRMSLKLGTRVHFYIEYDSSGEWHHLFTMTGMNLRSFAIPIRPRRCDHLRLRIEGDGEAKIYSICKTIGQGSDV